MRTDYKYLDEESSWGVSQAAFLETRLSLPVRSAREKSECLAYRIVRIYIGPKTNKEQTLKSSQSRAGDELTNNNTLRTKKPVENAQVLANRDQHQMFLMSNSKVPLSDKERKLLAKKKPRVVQTQEATSQVRKTECRNTTLGDISKLVPKVRTKEHNVDDTPVLSERVVEDHYTLKRHHEDKKENKKSQKIDQFYDHIFKHGITAMEFDGLRFDHDLSFIDVTRIKRTLKTYSAEAIVQEAFRYEALHTVVDEAYRLEAKQDHFYSRYPEGRPGAEIDEDGRNYFDYDGGRVYLMDPMHHPTVDAMQEIFVSYLKSPLHFWISKLLHMAASDYQTIPYIANDILMRYADLIKVNDASLGAAYGALAALVSTLAVSFIKARERSAAEQAEMGINAKYFGEADRVYTKSADFWSEAVDSNGKKWIYQKQAGVYDTLSGILGLIGDFNKVMSYTSSKSIVSDIIKALAIGGLAMTAYTSGKFSSFTMEGANALVVYALKRYTSEDSVFAGFFRIATSITTIIYGWFSGNATGNFSDFIQEVAAMEDMYDLLRKLAHEDSTWAARDSADRARWVREYHTLRAYAEKHLDAAKGFKSAKRYMSTRQVEEWRMKYQQLETRFKLDCASGLRRVPFATCFAGGSSIGKSSLVSYFAAMVLAMEERPPELLERLMYSVQDNGTDFNNGYNADCLVVVFDDMCSRRTALSEKQGGDPMRKMFCDLVNNVPMLANKAALEQKENCPMQPGGVLVTTNVPSLFPEEIHNFGAIMDRRFYNKVMIEIKPEFATRGEYLDGKKAQANYLERIKNDPENVEPDDYWIYHVYEPVLHNTTVNGNDYRLPEYEIQTRWKKIAVFDKALEFWAYMKTAYKKHHAAQHLLVDKLLQNRKFQWDKLPDFELDPNKANGRYAEPEEEPYYEEALEEHDIDEEAVEKQGYFFDGDIGDMPEIAIASSIALSSVYAAARVCRYVRDKVVRLDRIYSETEAILDVVRHHIPVAQELLNDGRDLVGNLGNTNEMAVNKMKDACNGLRQMITCFTTISAAIGVATIVGGAYKYFTKEEVAYHAQGNFISSAKMPSANINDVKAARYEYPTTGVINYLSKQSKSVQKNTLWHKALVANVPIIFCATVPNIGGQYSQIHTYGTFIKGKWLVYNHHCFPDHACAGQKQWADWTLTVERCVDNPGIGPLGSITMTRAEVLANTQSNFNSRDMVATYITNSRDYPDLSVWLPDVDEITEDICLPKGLPCIMLRHSQKARASEKPASPWGDPNGPHGYITKPHSYLRTKDEANTVTVVDMPIDSFVGDCGKLYLTLKSDNTPQMILGMHMGSMVARSSEKLVVPWCRADFDQLGKFPLQPYSYVPSRMEAMGEEVNLHLAQPETEMVKIFNAPPMLSTPHMKDPVKDWVGKTVMAVNGKEFKYTGSGCFVGQRVRLSSARFKTKIKIAPFAKVVKNKPTPFGKPFGSGKVLMDLTSSDVGNGVAVVLSRAWGQPPPNPDLKHKVDFVVRAMIQEVKDDIAANPDENVLTHLHRVSKDVALNGFSINEQIDWEGWQDEGILCVDDAIDIVGKGAKFKGLEAINRSTSAGYPHNEKPSPNGLKGKMGYIIRREGHKDILHEDMDKALEELRIVAQNGTHKILIKAVIKDEPMKPEKLKDGRIRFILVLPMEAVLLTREYLLTLCRIMALNPFFFSTMVGVDSSSIQWEQVHKFLTAGEAQEFDGDFQGFEFALYEEITDGIKQYYGELCALSKNYNAEELVMVQNLLTMLISCVVDYFGNVYSFKSVNSSGNSLTTQINCSGVVIWTNVALYDRMVELMGNRFTFEIFCKVRKIILRLATYGDDLLASIIRDVENGIELLDQKIMQDKLAKYGVTYTDSAKNAIIEKPFPDEVMFLGRSFSRDHVGRIVAKLEEARIMKPLEFTTEHETLPYPTLLISVVRSVLQETYYHGKDKFDAMFKYLLDNICETFEQDEEFVIKQYLSTSKGVLLDYDFFEKWFTEKYPKGAIVDKRYDEVVGQDPKVAKDLYREIADLMRAEGTLK